MCSGAMQVLPTCLLLHFAAADLEEAQGNLQAAHQVYQGLLPSLTPPDSAPPPQVPLLALHCCMHMWHVCCQQQ